MNWLLGMESFVSGVYSGLSTVALKIIVGFLNVISAEREGGDDVDNSELRKGLAMSFLLLLYAVLANLFTLNNVLSLYPSLKTVPCY